MTATRSSGWIQIRDACPVCGHRGYCTRTADGEIVKCMRSPNGRAVKQRDGGVGYLYRSDELPGNLSRAITPTPPPNRTATEWKNIIKSHQTAVNPSKLERLSAKLGVSVAALKLYGIGFDVGCDDRPGTGWWSFPMFDGDGKPCGIRLRSEDGEGKKCVWGSNNGLFVPNDYSDEPLPEGICSNESPLLLLFPEGPTSAAAAATLGFRAVGRPNNRIGSAMIRRFLSHGAPQDVVIVADDEGTKWRRGNPADPFPTELTVPFWPGWEGALLAARELMDANVSRLRVSKVKNGAGARVKDLRKFLCEGGTADLINRVIAQAEEATPIWIGEQIALVEDWREQMRLEKIDELEGRDANNT